MGANLPNPQYRSTRDISALHPRLRSIYIQFDGKMHLAGIDFIVTATYRNNVDQDALYAIGRTVGKKGATVTNAKGGESKHNNVDAQGAPLSLAFDIAIMRAGKIDWDKKNPDWKRAGAIGKSLGLVWAGDFKTFPEYPHFQLPEE